MSQIVNAQFSPPNRIPRPLTRVIDKATSKNPAKRFQSAAQFKSAIQVISDGISTGEIRIANQPTVRFPGRLAFVLAAIGLLIASLIYTLNSPQPDRAIAKSTKKSVAIKDDKTNQSPALEARPWTDFFDEQGRAKITIESVPHGAQLNLFVLTAGAPNASTGISLEFAPTPTTVRPGDYLVVAKWPDGSWTEVLRRIPRSKTQGVLPASPFDGFRRDKTSLRFAPVTKPDFSSNGMVSHDRFLIDAAVFQTDSDEIIPNAFGHACKILEQQGKRLPFVPELKEHFQNSKVQSSTDEWTCSFSSGHEFAKTLKCGRKVYMQFSDFLVVPAVDGGNVYPLADNKFRKRFVGFRGVRSSIPFGTLGK